jgi:cystathionine beta-lyase/cystathionine gamma-synthase
MNPEDLCPRPDRVPPLPAEPLVPAIYPAAVYRCESPEQAERLLSGELAGYVYSRDGHPNADVLSEKCRQLHGADQAAVCSSGMAALAVAMLSQLTGGDHLIASSHLYGRTLGLLEGELPRWGAECSVVDTCDLEAVRRAVCERTRLVVVETISNPLLRVADLTALAELAHAHGARLLVDNTFAGPTVCRPLERGADLVMESLTKIINGHSDVMLGLLCGRQECWARVPHVRTTWGFACSPFDCWLAARGLGTLALRAERASHNALCAARHLAARTEVRTVHYPGLPTHPDHALAGRQFGQQFGSMLAFELAGGQAAAERFIAAATRIPFSPSLGDLGTTLSHPVSTSHRSLAPQQRDRLGIGGGLIRLSVGIESAEAICEALDEGLS